MADGRRLRQAGGSAVLLSDPNWRVTHTLHTKVSQKSDILWRNDTTGQTALWLMDGLTATSAAILLSDPNWKVVPPE